jgi:hypothetical protein
MRRILVALGAAALLSAVQVGAGERATTPGTHLVTADVAQARLLEASAARERNLARVDALLVSPEGGAALKVVGVSEDRVRGALPTLSDAELQDLATRAAALQADPTAGGLTTKQWIWIIAAVVAIVVIIIVAS